MILEIESGELSSSQWDTSGPDLQRKLTMIRKKAEFYQQYMQGDFCLVWIQQMKNGVVGLVAEIQAIEMADLTAAFKAVYIWNYPWREMESWSGEWKYIDLVSFSRRYWKEIAFMLLTVKKRECFIVSSSPASGADCVRMEWWAGKPLVHLTGLEELMITLRRENSSIALNIYTTKWENMGAE